LSDAFSQGDIDAVLANAQGAVDDLAADVEALNNKPTATRSAAPAPYTAPVPAPAPTPAVAVGPVPTSKPTGRVSGQVRQILALEVPLVVRLAHRLMTIGEIMTLSPGSILEFERTVDQELDLMINNCQIGAGVAVKVDERFGLRITLIGNVRTRIGSLGAA
jgi:flagellar motor switch protein FliN/FliY